MTIKEIKTIFDQHIYYISDVSRYFSSPFSRKELLEATGNNLEEILDENYLGYRESFHETEREAVLWCHLLYEEEKTKALYEKIKTLTSYAEDLVDSHSYFYSNKK